MTRFLFSAALWIALSVGAVAQVSIPFPGPGASATIPVAFDANATAVTVTSSATSLSNSNLTVGNNPNRAIVAVINFSNSAVFNIVCTWNGVVAPSINQAVNGAGGLVAMVGLVAPAVGNQTMSCSWFGTSDAKLNVASWYNVRQTGGSTTFFNSTTNTGSTTPMATAITITANDAAIDGGTTNANFSAPTQTQLALNGSGAISLASSRSAGVAGSVTFQWTVTGGFPWAHIVTGIKAN